MSNPNCRCEFGPLEFFTVPGLSVWVPVGGYPPVSITQNGNRTARWTGGPVYPAPATLDTAEELWETPVAVLPAVESVLVAVSGELWSSDKINYTSPDWQTIDQPPLNHWVHDYWWWNDRPNRSILSELQ